MHIYIYIYTEPYNSSLLVEIKVLHNASNGQISKARKGSLDALVLNTLSMHYQYSITIGVGVVSSKLRLM